MASVSKFSLKNISKIYSENCPTSVLQSVLESWLFTKYYTSSAWSSQLMQGREMEIFGQLVVFSESSVSLQTLVSEGQEGSDVIQCWRLGWSLEAIKCKVVTKSPSNNGPCTGRFSTDTNWSGSVCLSIMKYYNFYWEYYRHMAAWETDKNSNNFVMITLSTVWGPFYNSYQPGFCSTYQPPVGYCRLSLYPWLTAFKVTIWQWIDLSCAHRSSLMKH